MVVKKDGTRERFERSEADRRAAEGVREAAGQRRRPSRTIADRVEQMLQDRAEKEIAARELGAFVMQELKQLDKVAYVRFASVYRHFRDIGEFMRELKVRALEGPQGVATPWPTAKRQLACRARPPRRRRRCARAAARRPFRDNPRLILAGIVMLLAVLGGIVVARRSHRRAVAGLPDRSRALSRSRPPTSRCCVALVFVLARNVIKSMVEGRRGLPFGRFRAKLVLALLGMTRDPGGARADRRQPRRADRRRSLVQRADGRDPRRRQQHRRRLLPGAPAARHRPGVAPGARR